MAESLIAGVPIMALILGLVEFGKKFGLEGKWNVLLAMVLGIAFGIVGNAMEAGHFPAEWTWWVTAIITGLVYGLAAAGIYKLGKRFWVQE